MGVGMSCDVPGNESMEKKIENESEPGVNEEEEQGACAVISEICEQGAKTCDNELHSRLNSTVDDTEIYQLERSNNRQESLSSLWHYPDMGVYGSTSDPLYGSTTCRVKVQVEVECSSSQKNCNKKCTRSGSLKKPRHKLKLVKEKKKRQPWSFKFNCRKSSKSGSEPESSTSSCTCNFCPNFRQEHQEYRQRELPCFEDLQSTSSKNIGDASTEETTLNNDLPVRPSNSRYPTDRFTISCNPVFDVQVVFEKSLHLGHASLGKFWTREHLLPYNPFGIHTQIDYVHYLVPDLIDITNCGFYWGKMDRFEAEKLLNNKPEGTFLLRDSAQDDYLFTVSFRRYERSLHARIEQCNHRFTFDARDPSVYQSTTVCGLLEHYKDPSCCMFFEPSLTNPLIRTFPFPLQHLCRATICSKITYDGINKLILPNKFILPKTLQNYLKEYHYKQRVSVRHWD